MIAHMARSNTGGFFAFCAKAACAFLLGAAIVIGGTNAYVVTSATPSIFGWFAIRWIVVGFSSCFD